MLNERTGYAERNGALVVVLAARRYGRWECDEPGSGRARQVQPGLRYEIGCPWGQWFVEECMLREVYDGEALSTWAAFEQATGLRLARHAC